MSYVDDDILMTKLAAGNEAAFNILFERYRDKLYNYLFKITKSAEISEEIVIDIFVKLWVGRELSGRIEKVENFLHKVAYHKAIDFLKTTSRHARLQKIYIERTVQGAEQTVEDIIIDEESKKILQKAIYSLPPQRKLIYTLSRTEGLSHEEIAKALNLSRNTVKNSMMAAVKSITVFLQKKNFDKNFSLIFFFS